MTPVYTNVAYRAGYQGYLAALQSAPLVTVDAMQHPTRGSPSVWLGLCQLPAWNVAENMHPIESIGSMRDGSFVPGRRECSVQTRIMVSNFSLFANGASSASYVAIRNHGQPAGTGTVNGLQLCILFLGAGSAYGTDFGLAAVDSLLNTLRFSRAESQPVTAEVEFWPIAILQTWVQTQDNLPTGYAVRPLIWQQLQSTIGGTDYKAVLASVTVAVTNNLERIGTRNIIAASGGEAADRCPGREEL
ncbi:MAG: hypothetical protein H5T86_08175 [Armatimonadetes bacterium]|nr:hypothetical protein [Armatimonadota bacterium]